jgi:dTDP-glucose pyrophosphorylase
MKNNWKDITLTKKATIKDAMKVLDIGLRIVLIVDENNKFVATITDGDIRRGLLRGESLDSAVVKIMNSNPTFILPGLSQHAIHNKLHHHKVLALPVVDENKNIIGFETIDNLDEEDPDALIVLMAGGFGKRLMPLTENTPKPMLPLVDTPILEHIIDTFIMQGFRNFCITTHYKAEIIKGHLKQDKYANITIDFVTEDEPLGTAGSLFLLSDKVKTNFIVMNSDLLIKTDFKNLLDFHKKHGEIGTVCTKEYTHQVPYGVVCLEDMHISKIVEKPTYSHFINAGVYCFNKNVFDYIREEKYLDMPNLLQKIIQDKKKLSAFPIHEYWLDIGNTKDYKQAQLDYK